MTSFLPKLTSRVWLVWRRNLEVFTKTIFVNFLPALMEPILYLAAFGFGLGALFGASNIPGYAGSYVQYIGPGLVAIAVMYGSFFECTYASFMRMYFQKTFDAIIATPVSVEEVIAGELLWGATRASINGTIVLVVVAAFGLISSPLAILVPLVCFFGGLLFASLCLCFTAVAKTIDFINFPTFLFITPMFLLSGTFFPLTIIHSTALEAVALSVFPLTHVVDTARGLMSGDIGSLVGLDSTIMWIVALVRVAAVTLLFFMLAIKLMKKKLIK